MSVISYMYDKNFFKTYFFHRNEIGEGGRREVERPFPRKEKNRRKKMP